jgi:hypothetical protein
VRHLATIEPASQASRDGRGDVRRTEVVPFRLRLIRNGKVDREARLDAVLLAKVALLRFGQRFRAIMLEHISSPRLDGESSGQHIKGVSTLAIMAADCSQHPTLALAKDAGERSQLATIERCHGMKVSALVA